MGSDAIQEWQRGVVAIGTRNPNLPKSALVGTGFIVDLQSGLIVTCAHVALDAYEAHKLSPATRMDPGVAGVAIGVGIGEEVTWVCRAELRYISRPPVGYPGPDPPHHWVVKDHGARLDLAVLQLVELDGSTLRRNPGEVLARGARTARALSLGVPPPTPRSVPLSDGAELVMLGYGQSGSGKGAEQTSTTMRGHYAGRYSSNGVVPGSLQSGDWLKVDVRILSAQGTTRAGRGVAGADGCVGAPQSSNTRPSRRSAAPRPHRPAGTTVRSMGDVRRMGMRGVGHAARAGGVAGVHRALMRVLRCHFSLVARSCTCEHSNQCEGQGCSGVCANGPATVCGTGLHATPKRARRACAGGWEVLPRRHGTWRAAWNLGAVR
jgi:hypothetical protein